MISKHVIEELAKLNKELSNTHKIDAFILDVINQIRTNQLILNKRGYYVCNIGGLFTSLFHLNGPLPLKAYEELSEAFKEAGFTVKPFVGTEHLIDKFFFKPS
jgi:hypothetical protein